MTGSQPLRDEHAEFVPQIAALAAAGDAVGSVSVDELIELLGDSHRFLVHQLLPHARAEEAALYPAVQRAVGDRHITATMSRDHAEVEALTGELEQVLARLSSSTQLLESDARVLRRVLYGLHHLVKVHFAKEEEIYLPILEAHLTDADFSTLFSAMATTAHQHEADH